MQSRFPWRIWLLAGLTRSAWNSYSGFMVDLCYSEPSWQEKTNNQGIGTLRRSLTLAWLTRPASRNFSILSCYVCSTKWFGHPKILSRHSRNFTKPTVSLIDFWISNWPGNEYKITSRGHIFMPETIDLKQFTGWTSKNCQRAPGYWNCWFCSSESNLCHGLWRENCFRKRVRQSWVQHTLSNGQCVINKALLPLFKDLTCFSVFLIPSWIVISILIHKCHFVAKLKSSKPFPQPKYHTNNSPGQKHWLVMSVLHAPEPLCYPLAVVVIDSLFARLQISFIVNFALHGELRISCKVVLEKDLVAFQFRYNSC